MNLLEAMNRVDRSQSNTSYVGPEFYSDLMGRDIWLEKDAPRIKAYYLAPWNCTDTWVGATVYYLDDRPLAWGFQTARKNSELWSYVDQSVVDDARAYLAGLLDEPVSAVKFIRSDEEIGDSYTVEYRDQLLTEHGRVAGRTATYLRSESRRWLGINIPNEGYGYLFPGDTKETYRESIIVVRYDDDGSQEAIKITRFEIPYRVV